MKVGIVTISDITNYGNRLQNYAVQKILRTGYGCKTVSLASIEEKSFNNGNYLAWCKEQIARMLCIFPNYAEKRFGNNITRWTNFKRWNNNIKTKIYYKNSCLPTRINNEYDYFVSGSDQVWNYHFVANKFNDYFLQFATAEKKVALSASFGVEEIPENWKNVYRDSLKTFENISVREEAGQAIVKELLGIEVPVLIDPTMMLTKDEWLSVSRKPRVDCSKPYVLKYYLGDESEEEKIDVWAKDNGYEVYELLNEQIPELYSAGPGEFISLIANASLVCSDSFHCIVFSIIFSRPFLVYARQGKENYMTSRLDTLLNKFGFQNRWKHLVSPDDYLKCDYSLVPELLMKEQEKFMEYLSNAIKQ